MICNGRNDRNRAWFQRPKVDDYAEEGYLFGVLHWWAAFGLAVVAVGFWWFVGRGNRNDSVRHVAWIFAASQLLVLCVPIALSLVKAVAIAVIALLAIAALIFLFTERP